MTPQMDIMEPERMAADQIETEQEVSFLMILAENWQQPIGHPSLAQ